MSSNQLYSQIKVSFLLVLLLIVWNYINITPAWAKTVSFNATISAEKNWTFTTLRQQAEFLTNNLIKQKFIENSSINEVSITIIAERNGQHVPLLSTKISRSNWQVKPQIQNWAKYFSKAEVLLGFLNSQNLQANSSHQTVAFKPAKRIIENDPGFRDD